MKLGIISDCHHYYNEDGKLCSLTPVVRQFEKWAQMFDQVIICAPLLTGTPPATYQTPYKESNIKLLPISNAGGDTLRAKLFLARKTLDWWHTLQQLIEQVDAVHVRCPNNISILGLLAIHRTRLLRQAVYTGSWLGYKNEPLSYKAQRIFLKYFFRGPVAVYGTWPGQPAHVVPSFSPSYTQSDWEMESAQVARRSQALDGLDHLPTPIHLLSVGSLNRNKNQRLIIEALHHLVQQGVDCRLDLLGDGDQRAALEKQVQAQGLKKRVIFHGNVAQITVRQLYRRATFVIQAPYTEGFGKVPIEAFFHGAVPLLSDAGMSSQILDNTQRGRIFQQGDVQALVNHILELAADPGEIIRLISNGREYSKMMTIEAWHAHIQSMLEFYWSVKIEKKVI